MQKAMRFKLNLQIALPNEIYILNSHNSTQISQLLNLMLFYRFETSSLRLVAENTRLYLKKNSVLNSIDLIPI